METEGCDPRATAPEENEKTPEVTEPVTKRFCTIRPWFMSSRKGLCVRNIVLALLEEGFVL